MEQLVAQMMKPEVEVPPLAVGEELRALSKTSTGETIPPPASDVDTVRPRGDDAKTIPPTGDEPLSLVDDAATIPPEADDTLPLGLDDIVTMPPPRGDDPDTLPPAPPEIAIAEEHEAIYRGVVPRESAVSVTAHALDTAEAIFEELGVEFFEARSSVRDVKPEEPRTRPVEEPPRTRPPEEIPRTRPPEEIARVRPPEEPPRSRLAPSSRHTPPRTVRPDLDAQPPPPPSVVSSRPGMQRRKPSEPQMRADPIVPVERVTPSSPNAPVSERLNEVRERYEAGDYRAALTIAESILATHPDHLAALGYAESSRQMLRQKYLARIGDTSHVPRLKAAPQEVARLVNDERALRIAQAVDGARSIDDIIAASGMPTLDVLCVLHDLLVAGGIEIGSYGWGRR
jgi:hypothetical protein